jgi:MoaA/NifB/PqqE/SkfB family radical SAM enzyme
MFGGWLRGRPVYASWQLVRRCSGGLCQFCEHRAEGGEPELSTGECLRVLEGLSGLGSLVLSFSGCEPLLHPGLRELVAAASARHEVRLTTHGWLVTPAVARGLWEAGLRSASVVLYDGDAACHDARVGLPGGHARAVAAAQALLEGSRGAVHFKLALDPAGGAAALDRALGLAEQVGVGLAVDLPYPLPAAGAALTPLLQEARRRGRPLVSSPGVIEGVDRALAGGVPGCPAGRAFLNVDHLGRLSRCVEFQGPEHAAGSLLDEAAPVLLDRLRAACAGHGCTACWHGFRGEVQALYTARGALQALPGLWR